MQKIFIAGNLLIKEDSIALKIMPKLQKKFPNIEFIELEPTDNFPEERILTIIDAVQGINEIKIIEDIDKITFQKSFSLHDFDLGANLKLLKKAGKLEAVKIIGIPMQWKEKQAFEEISKEIEKLFNE
ncbi:MAG: hypothetical protein Q7S21_00545 [archaeon]|nr:hypothetical protein [archaeon]